MEMHSLKFTMEDLTKRLHIGRNSLYKAFPSKDALIKSIVEYEISEFEEKQAEILSGEESVDIKAKKIIRLYIDTFGVTVNHTGGDLQNMYPKVWNEWQKFHQGMIHKLMELIKIGVNEGIYRDLNFKIVEECLIMILSAVGSSVFLNRTKFSYIDVIETLEDLILYGLKKN